MDLPWGKWIKGLRALGKASKKGNCPVRGHSFLPDTQVLLSDGTRKDIEDVEIGDEVVVTDPETGETTTRVVVVTIVTADDKNFVDVTVTTDDGPASLVSTVNHPFWSESEARWTDAGDLKAGTILRTPDGDTVTVTATRHFTQRQRTHDLTIDDIHTYYVLAGQTPVLVHNSSLCGTAALEGGDWKHILDRHRPGGALVDDEAGLFIGKEKKVRQRIIDTINRGTPKANTPDPVTGAPRPGQIYEWDFGDTIGKAGPANGGGNLTSVRVIVNDGKVVTAFPF